MHRPRSASAPLAMVRFQNGWLYTCQVFDLAIPESGAVVTQARRHLEIKFDIALNISLMFTRFFEPKFIEVKEGI